MTDYRARSMWLDGVPGELTPGPRSPAPSTSTWPSSAPGSPGCGRPTTSRRPTRTCASPCWSARSPGSAPRAATAAGATPPSPAPVSWRRRRTAGRPSSTSSAPCTGRCTRSRASWTKRASTRASTSAASWTSPLTPVQLLRAARGDRVRALLGLRRGRLRRCSAPPTCASASRWPGASAPATRRTAPPWTRPGWPAASRTWSSGWACPSTSARPSPASSRASPTTPFGDVRADVVVRATEAFTPELPGYERTLVPIYSLMIGTEPLPEAFWDEVGWSGREVFGDFRFLIFYAMHTEDGRIAIGGRGAPYHYGSQSERGLRARARRAGPPQRAARRALPRHRRVQRDAPLGRRDRGRPRLVHLGRPGPRHRHGLGRRLRRRRRVDDQPRRRARCATSSSGAEPPSSRRCRG